jgi:hypothetical protein
MVVTRFAVLGLAELQSRPERRLPDRLALHRSVSGRRTVALKAIFPKVVPARTMPSGHPLVISAAWWKE